MVMRRAGADTDQAARSLLQKAIRRGRADIATAVFRFLATNKTEFNWMRSRLAVFTFEEAWPYGRHVTFSKAEDENLRHILALCSLQKNKDAAGLGSLAYALTEGNDSVLRDDDDDWYVRVVARALGDKDKFRAWARDEALHLDPDQALVVSKAIEGSKKAGWPWDKAFTYAAALLAIKYPVPGLVDAPLSATDPFPFWVAIDKHTQQGKEAIRRAAKNLGIPANSALWLSFYFESATCQSLAPSPWWDRERSWRLGKLGLSEVDGRDAWGQLRTLVEGYLGPDAEALSERVLAPPERDSQTDSSQMRLC